MTPPPPSRHNGPDGIVPVPRPHLEEPADTDLPGEDLLGDLDPGWLAWRDAQAKQ